MNTSAGTDRRIAMAEGFPTYIELVKLNTRQIDEMIRMKMGDDYVLFERHFFATIDNYIAGQVVHKICGLI